MADQLDVSQLGVQVEYEDPPLQKVSQVGVQVEYEDTPRMVVSNVFAQVETLLPSRLAVSQLYAQVEYDKTRILTGGISVSLTPSSVINMIPTQYATGSIDITMSLSMVVKAGNELDGTITILLTPSSASEQFPCFWPEAGVDISLTPESVSAYYPCYWPTAEAPISLTPSSSVTYIPAYHCWAHGVTIDLVPSSLNVGPRYRDGNVPIALTPSSTRQQTALILAMEIPLTLSTSFTVETIGIALPTTYSVTATGGIGLGGNTTVEFIDPGIFNFPEDDLDYREGWMEMGGESELDFPAPETFELEASGGFELSGPFGAVVFSTQTTTEATGGFVLGGASTIAFVTNFVSFALEATGGFILGSEQNYVVVVPETFELSSTGGLRLSSNSEIAFSIPETYSLIAHGGMWMGGESTVEFTDAPIPYELESSGGFEFGSKSSIAFVHPEILHVIASGGFLLGSDAIGLEESEETYLTWSVMGDEFNASIYSGWRFNSYASYQNREYAAGEDGIYLIGGELDETQPIHTGVRIGPSNLGVHNPKRIRRVKVNNDSANVIVSASIDRDVSPNHPDGAFITGLVEGVELTIDIVDFERLSHIEIIPLILARR